MEIYFLSILPILISLIALWISIQNNSKNLGVNAFIAYTNKYHNIIETFPKDTWFKRFDDTPPHNTIELRLAILKYLHLCNEEFYLFERGLISNKIWSVWGNEIKLDLNSTLIKREWNSLSSYFEGYPEFLAFVNSNKH